jgi:putative chitinase
MQSIMPLSVSRLPDFLLPLNSAMIEFGIDTPIRQAAFLSQIAHESTELLRLVENLNYSAEGLARTWPSRFQDKNKQPNSLAYELNRKAEAIANSVYANRLGNGNSASGDGWKYRGRGLIQVTGRDNYLACSKALYGDDTLIRYPELLEKPKDACRSAAWFWKVNNINIMADKDDFDGVCDLVNRGKKTAAIGDSIGYADRLKCYKRAKTALGA